MSKPHKARSKRGGFTKLTKREIADIKRGCLMALEDTLSKAEEHRGDPAGNHDNAGS